MSPGESARQPTMVRLWVALVVGSVLAVLFVALVGFLAYVSSDQNRKSMPLGFFVPTEEEIAEGNILAPVLIGLADHTDEVCPEIGCNQAYVGDRVTLLRFDTKDQASGHTYSLRGEGYQSDWIVAHFTDPTVTNQERYWVGQVLDETWTSD